MKKKEFSDEEEVVKILEDSIKKIAIYTKELSSNNLQKLLDFFFARLIDNEITRSQEEEKNFLDAVIAKAAAFTIVLQIILYLILTDNNESRNETVLLFNKKDQIQEEFNRINLNQVYRSIFDINIITLLPNESIKTLNLVIKQLSTIKDLVIKKDILGKIFHSLIPFELRKLLAAYYSSNIVGDFLATLVIKDPDISLMDPACGSGTLLVSAHKRIKKIGKGLVHLDILNKIYGVDVSLFASQLTIINLIIQNPTVKVKKCHIANMDAFQVPIETDIKSNENFSFPQMDVLIGNPPFTRADRLDSNYKVFLESHLRSQGISIRYNKKYLGLYGYFLLDSLRILKENGILAFILPLSTINSISMKPVLQHLMNNYNIKYIISSDAQITFSEQCTFKEIIFVAQKTNAIGFKTKFINLKQNLSPNNYMNLIEKIETINKNYEDHMIRIRVVSKAELLDNLNIKWTVFLYDQSFFEIFHTIKSSTVISNVNEIVKIPRYDVDRGFRAGITNFFYLPNKHWDIVDKNNSFIIIKSTENATMLNINRKYLMPLLRKSSKYKSIIPKISDYVLVCPPEYNIDSDLGVYIKWGSYKFQKNHGFESLAQNSLNKNRKIARIGISHELCLKNGKIIAYYSPKPIFLSDNFIFIRTFNEESDKILTAYLNSSLFLLTYFILRREKGGSLGQIFGTDMRNFFIINPQKMETEEKKELMHIFNAFTEKSEEFMTLDGQIVEAMKTKRTIRYQLDYCLCKILKINDPFIFLEKLYRILEKELSKFI